MTSLRAFFALVLAASLANANAQTPAPVGSLKGDAWVHSSDSLAASVQQADVCLPASATGGSVYCGKFKAIPALSGAKVPVILFLHGSSGLGLKGIGEWQQWLAGIVGPEWHAQCRAVRSAGPRATAPLWGGRRPGAGRSDRAGSIFLALLP